jgi:hypothetical protein
MRHAGLLQPLSIPT